jgi:hypothetical protein
LLTGQTSVQEVLFFPQMRPEKPVTQQDETDPSQDKITSV